MAALLGGGGTGCFEDRPRPAPPRLQLTLTSDTVTSPDTLTGAVRVDDTDGIDSIWVTVDTVRRGDDGFFQTSYSTVFVFPIRSGFVKGDHILVRLEARDVVGFRGSLDTAVVVRGP